jgi:DNA-binding SARP family transcriptional activator
MLSGFALRRDDVPVPLPQSAERLLAFLAVHDRALERSFVAGSLWLDASESHASGSLRSALWRVHNADGQVIESAGTRLRIAPHVHVDLRAAHALAGSILEIGGGGKAAQTPTRAIATLDSDLLPDWYVEDWLALPREQWRQVRLHALETLAVGLAARGEFAAAVSAALASIRGEPLRESAHRCLVQVHLAEGNFSEAVAAFQRFQKLLWSELGVEPSSSFERLVDDLPPRRIPSSRSC